MSDIYKLPVWIDPPKLAQAAAVIEGRLSMQSMALLQQHLEGSVAELELFCRLQFDIEAKRVICEGQLQADLPLLCQRCLEVVTIRVEKNLRYCWLEPGDSDEHVDADYEALWLEEVPLKLATLLEEELVLSLPFIAKHEHCPSLADEIAECLVVVDEIEVETETAETKPNPFAVLKQLK